ncbi:2-oxo-4-hydroxy-4-carboxy-5-ureidoimidazoline decarboxylase [Haloarcula sp. S1CR25-12]|uniref:2-oxo-4-hydroxy-4-carboxy-5-ureidoimidazoline decarboxylase n=1 Tax=Haloarcula saliterrae TaxID=2950534 RepID=A0ABU2FFU2_9EURY|nr:2-oxo-4-hydroxy-4-carboxy-5-ureidoimidazoline decarboxylase [Haloarcula sp. S1CR25-12]MDS0261109.1 2-oxo-4-hydroxy-4-carboxy-5-ureidoimidazoline decarboxylase [Haloarcula sp. S1CR25-12]
MPDTNIAELNELDRDRFVAVLGGVYEESPWVARGAYADQPFESVTDVATALEAVVRDASHERRLELLRAHPDLGEQTEMTDASAAEQSSAGLDQLRPELYEEFQRLNDLYRDRFGFPFIMAVKNESPEAIRAAMEQRVEQSEQEEFETALSEVHKIARLRLDDIVDSSVTRD